MGTINYKTSDYLTMGLNPISSYDLENDSGFMEELKQQIFSKCDEICISPWDFAQKLWECCRSIPDEITKMNPVDFGMIESSFIVGTITAAKLCDMIPMLFGHSANEGGIHNE